MTPLFTWRDVERHLSQVKSPPWSTWSTNLETLTIDCASDRREAAMARLASLFGPRLSKDGAKLELESTVEAPRYLTVVIEPMKDGTPSRPRPVRPLWPDALTVPINLPPLPPGSPKVGAFYSYKGGVGRTTTLLATLGALLGMRQPRSISVLVVDADLEAPGISFEIPGPVDRFCLLDFLSLVQDADDWRASAVPIAAERVQKSRQTIELAGGRASFFFLPAFLDPEQLFAPDVTTEQLVRGRGRAHVLAEALAALGAAVGADVVLVDLRAGVTEIASPLLLDPRVQTILVTSCGGQSIAGTELVLQRMAARVVPETSPEVVLTMIPTEFQSAAVAELLGRLKSSIPRAAEEEVTDELAQSNIHEVRFAQELVHFDSVQELLGTLVPGTDLDRSAVQLAKILAPRPKVENSAGNAAAVTTPKDGLKKVAAEARKLEFAEGNATLGLLSTPALTALVEQFPRGLPAVVVLGAKGAGKTFAWGQLVLAGTWQKFASLVTQSAKPVASPSRLVHIFPLLSPRNMTEELAVKVNEAEKACLAALGAPSRPPLPSEKLFSDLPAKAQESGETAFWTGQIAARLGLQESAGASLEALAETLAARGVAICLTVDGLEDAFQFSPQLPLSTDQQAQLRGLLQHLTIKVRDLRSPHLGIVNFVRRDLAQAAIPQNFGQFEVLFEQFSIAWTPTEALRLVAWLLQRSGLTFVSPDRLQLASYDELRDKLKEFWGERLGTRDSKEAYTDKWVIAALSDFQGRLQARDLVRLVRYAAAAESAGPMLTPKALRAAVGKCSEDKIKELATEIPGLSALFDRFRSGEEDKRKIPFRREDFGLTSEEVAFLESQGIVIQIEQGDLYLPEIVRHGLSFRLDKGRRAKVLALYRAAQAKRAT